MFLSVLTRKFSLFSSQKKFTTEKQKLGSFLVAFGKFVAFYYVNMKPNGQKNEIRCEHTRGAPESSMLQI